MDTLVPMRITDIFTKNNCSFFGNKAAFQYMKKAKNVVRLKKEVKTFIVVYKWLHSLKEGSLVNQRIE